MKKKQKVFLITNYISEWMDLTNGKSLYLCLFVHEKLYDFLFVLLFNHNLI